MSDQFPIFEPDIMVSAREVFNVDFDMQVPAFSKPSENVPPVDEAYIFDDKTTQAICAGFAYDAALWYRAITGQENPPILNKSPRG